MRGIDQCRMFFSLLVDIPNGDRFVYSPSHDVYACFPGHVPFFSRAKMIEDPCRGVTYLQYFTWPIVLRTEEKSRTKEFKKVESDPPPPTLFTINQCLTGRFEV